MSSGDKFLNFLFIRNISISFFWKTVLVEYMILGWKFWFEHFKMLASSSWVHCFSKNSVVNLIEVPLEVMSQLSLAFRIFFLSFSFSTSLLSLCECLCVYLDFCWFSTWKLRFPKVSAVFQSYFSFSLSPHIFIAGILVNLILSHIFLGLYSFFFFFPIYFSLQISIDLSPSSLMPFCQFRFTV